MFVEIFNELLAENDLNKKKFAEKSGIPYPTVIGWTNLNRLPDYSALMKIADFFQCSVDFLMGRKSDYIAMYPLRAAGDPAEREFLGNYNKLNEKDRALVQQLVASLLK